MTKAALRSRYCGRAKRVETNNLEQIVPREGAAALAMLAACWLAATLLALAKAKGWW